MLTMSQHKADSAENTNCKKRIKLNSADQKYSNLNEN